MSLNRNPRSSTTHNPAIESKYSLPRMSLFSPQTLRRMGITETMLSSFESKMKNVTEARTSYLQDQKFALFTRQNNTHSTLRDVGIGILAALVQLPICIAAGLLEQNLYTFFGQRPDVQMPPMGVSRDPFLYCVALGILAALFEEFIFRKLLMPDIKEPLIRSGMSESRADFTSLLCSSALFGGIHGPGRRLHSFVGGMMTGALVQSQNGRMTSAYVEHSTYNTMIYSLSAYYRR
jgi:membrane protease YdiL (CAAX protease family)